MKIHSRHWFLRFSHLSVWCLISHRHTDKTFHQKFYLNIVLLITKQLKVFRKIIHMVIIFHNINSGRIFYQQKKNKFKDGEKCVQHANNKLNCVDKKTSWKTPSILQIRQIQPLGTGNRRGYANPKARRFTYVHRTLGKTSISYFRKKNHN